MRVFDISQVEVFNQELASQSQLPEYKEPTKLKGEDAKELYIKSVEGLSNEYNIDIKEQGIFNGSNGFYNLTHKYIRIEESLDYNHKFKTLIHELAHHIYNINGTDEGLTHSEMELKAETTAFMVCRELGIDSSEYSFEYLAGWGASSENVADKFLKHYKNISECVKEILGKIEG